MSAKIIVAGLNRVKVFLNKVYDIIIFVNGATNKFLSIEWNYIVGVIIRSKFGNSSTSMKEVNFNFIRIWPEKALFFEG